MVILKGLITLVLLILSQIFNANAEAKKKQNEIYEQIKDGIKEGDVSAITAGLDGLR